ncbi:uncharacterized protein LOC130742889 [Lotus japonicus]|uniref:uncharacterized protein LOC130742889 n=1 Tax=Lotus japonicus TaxID=34305 RepID=UPI0025867392|nr:uncharacterized protein LOC130742889 [Lotus japonicus]
MEEEEQATSSPFWLQNSSSGRRRLRRSYSLFATSGTLLICLVVIALAFILVLIPTLQSFTSHIFKPQSVKKSWDSLNLILVLFAILCGFLSRNNTATNNNETPRSYEDNQSFSDTKPWFEENPDPTPYYRLKSFNSYPDLRQESSWGNERWRFSDDTRVNGYRGLDMDTANKEEEEEKEQSIEKQSTEKQSIEKQSIMKQSIKNIEVDTFEAISNVGRNKEKAIEKPKLKGSESDTEKLLQAREKKKNNKASATKELLASLKGKKKKQRSRSVENFQSMLNSDQPPFPLPSHPPTPPPLPSPSSDFHNLFYSKKRKHKKLISASPPPQPPPLPPSRHLSSKLVSKTKPLHQGVVNKEESFFALEEKVLLTGNESPLNSIPPPPPPPPPFKMPVWKFRVQGDFVRIDSIKSSFPDSDEGVDSATGEDGEIQLFYASPDVDSKADNFIERFRAGLRIEKMNSTKEKQGLGKSNLWPGLS